VRSLFAQFILFCFFCKKNVMPVNKNALLRYQTIDQCLCNRQRRWTLEDLLRECSKALGAEPDEPLRVSRRTLQGDLEMMRSGKLGYEAPIEVVEKKYYCYTDPAFSISSVPVTTQELGRMREGIALLLQFAGFEHLAEIEDVVDRLEARMRKNTGEARLDSTVVELESSRLNSGTHLMPDLINLLQEGHVLRVSYQAFHRKPTVIRLHGYLLKEYGERWYLIGYEQLRRKIMNLPLDRIKDVRSEGTTGFIPNTFFDPKSYYRDTIGVTVYPQSKPRKILLWLEPKFAPYLLTKPLHHSQQTVKKLADGAVVISLYVRINYELLRELLSCGSGCVVLSPVKLRREVEAMLRTTADRYADNAWRAEVWQELKRSAAKR
jgi:predicted DNA-binding transcriptional regulator YafY